MQWLAMPLPVPTVKQQIEIERCAATFLNVAVPPKKFTLLPPDESAIKNALLELDAAVLRLYKLPPELERQLLAVFDGVDRLGVGCTFRGYPLGWSSRPIESIDDFFAEMDPYTVNVADFDDSREAIYKRMEGE